MPKRASKSPTPTPPYACLRRTLLPLILILITITALAPSTGLHASALPPHPAASAARGLLPTPTPAASAAPAPLTLAGWNIGLDDADPAVIASTLAAFDGVDLWGLAEVNRAAAAAVLEAGAEVGEHADFGRVLGASGGGMRLLALYDTSRFDLLGSQELDAINTTGTVRAPLVLHLRDKVSGQEFLFMINHLYRSKDAERARQAQLLNEWAAAQTLPVIAVGDYNFDWSLRNGAGDHDAGYDRMTAGGVWAWVQPATLVTTQCSGWPCAYNSVLDFVFLAGPAQAWRAESEIVVRPGDFPDDTTTSDHRPVVARVWPGSAAGVAPTAVPVAVGGTANTVANLRAGPGTNYAVVGRVNAGDAVPAVARSADGEWLQVRDGVWIAAVLVDGVAAGLPVVGAGVVAVPVAPAAPTPIPLAPTPVPAAATPVAADPAPAGKAQLAIVALDKRAEYADIRNNGAAPVDLSGWVLRSERGSQDCALAGVIQPGETLRVWAMGGEGGFDCGFGSNIWNNSEADPAVLLGPGGGEVGRFGR